MRDLLTFVFAPSAVPIEVAPGAASYEYDAPLQHVGVDAMPDDFRWDVPDPRIFVGDDIAVTWGLTRLEAMSNWAVVVR